MKELDFATLFSVFQEMLGPWIWLVIALAVLITVGFVYVLIRDRGFSSGRLVRSEILAPVGGLASVLIMQRITDSRFSDIGGPIDVILVALIFIAGMIGTVMLAYLFQSLTRSGAERS
ncbi:MAG TPA: DUF5368 domain-containing protein [Hyphomicrobiaceae bacterium]|nr:DUF5368 domain-containing protein [Hyphomicrobiaceae bacterium]